MDQRFYDAASSSPIIAAVKDEKGLEECCTVEGIKIVFLLFGNVCTIGSYVKILHNAGKIAMVHIDLIKGLSAEESAVDYLKDVAGADGILSTRESVIRYAQERKLFTVYRIFIIDSLALENIRKLEQIPYYKKPDFVEIMPGVMPKIIKLICETITVPVIAGGMIRDKEDVVSALSAGATAISSTNHNVWYL